MKIVVCGGTGFIGKALTEYLLKEQSEQSHRVIIVTRNQPKNTMHHPQLEYMTWDQIHNNPSLLEGIDTLVNLAGASLSQLWTRQAKERIIQSRMKTVSAVAKLIASLKRKPPVVIQASAIAIYGTSFHETFDETHQPRVNDFPSDVVEQWEHAADNIQNVRLVKLRVSVVLGNEGGAFPMMKLPYMLGAGGRIGSGQQWMSWIHIHDIVRLIEFCIINPNIEGPVNASSPEPVTNDKFGRSVGAVYHRPHWFPVPSFLLKTIVGELSLILLQGQRVIPAKALNHGFMFTYPRLKTALEELKTSK
ncbi:TIGR01777 family oxidoreductase [Paenibacillus sp. IHBB 10380]|uniref:TIGR01777 family oxidoreductase n=1 Tax=Paenibacillus sp. IHBB 10380 TaxID=1566358 RepID=UPI0005CFC687|nr:TIGR01777 family oxidoreductase [Paenibacillus sp. IHBB 10380]AJS59827.1 hypothetical protein UB51_16575 [Paenibacillus sp. IHBB 10380]